GVEAPVGKLPRCARAVDALAVRLDLAGGIADLGRYLKLQVLHLRLGLRELQPCPDEVGFGGARADWIGNVYAHRPGRIRVAENVPRRGAERLLGPAPPATRFSGKRLYGPRGAAAARVPRVAYRGVALGRALVVKVLDVDVASPGAGPSQLPVGSAGQRPP